MSDWECDELRRCDVITTQWCPKTQALVSLEYKNVPFLGFGVDYEESENGMGSFSVALIETPERKVVMIPLDAITFVDNK